MRFGTHMASVEAVRGFAEVDPLSARVGQLSQRLAMAAARIGRATFRGTRVQRWSVTTAIYRRLSSAAQEHSSASCILVKFRGAVFSVPSDDFTMLVSLQLGDYEVNELDEILALIPTGGTVVDVGANVGIYSVLAAFQVGPLGRVVSIEPVPSTIELLRGNLHMNAVEDRVDVIAAAAGDHMGTTHVGTDGPAGTRSVLVPGQAPVKVPVVSLDSVLAPFQRIDCIKIDVEGFEPSVVRGAVETLRRHRPWLLVELGASPGTATKAAVSRMLDDLVESGLVPRRMYPSRGLPFNAGLHDVRDAISRGAYANALFGRPEADRARG